MSVGHSGVAPPESFPNSEVKHTSADGSVGSPHARVGHRQTINKTAPSLRWGLFLCPKQTPYFSSGYDQSPISPINNPTYIC